MFYSEGSFGSVFKVKRKSDGLILVWKELEYKEMSEKERHQLAQEVNIMSQLEHNNIVRYFDRYSLSILTFFRIIDK